MIDLRYKPYHLPQVSAPYIYVVDKLGKEGIETEMVDMHPKDLGVMQGIAFSDEVHNIDLDNADPIWVSNDNKVIDGHHRFLKGEMEDRPIKVIKILNMNALDSARILNKIQDIYEYEQEMIAEYEDQLEMEEVVSQNAINLNNEIDSGTENIEYNNQLDFLSELESAELPEGNSMKMFGYREKPISENSIVGNFFLIEPVEGFDKYEIDFENVLDTNDIGLDFKEENPIDVLAKVWFPNVNFDTLSEEKNISPVNLKNKIIAEKASQMGYDGIKYGDRFIQGLK